MQHNIGEQSSRRNKNFIGMSDHQLDHRGERRRVQSTARLQVRRTTVALQYTHRRTAHKRWREYHGQISGRHSIRALIGGALCEQAQYELE